MIICEQLGTVSVLAGKGRFPKQASVDDTAFKTE